MNPDGKIRSILIVGGGTAGWMAATYLNTFLRGRGCTVTLVESADIGTIGVGEATIPTLVKFVRNNKLNEEEFMRECYATYKLAIRFVDWIHLGQEYWHPFGLCGGKIDGLDLFHYWLQSLRAGRPEGPYTSYSLQALLAQHDRGPRPLNDSSPIIEQGTYAYHLDAGALAAFLKMKAVSNGVKHLFDEISDVVLGEHGRISHLLTRSRRTLEADLFIDCTGFRARLVEQALGDPWIDWSHHLLCDRAVALPVPRDVRMRPYTCTTARSAGWIWEIPQSHRVGCGYVHSSRHIDEESAIRELLALVAPDGKRVGDPRVIKIRVGRRKNGWVKNAVSIGLASGFIEPLESTGIFFIQRGIELLLDYFPDLTFNEALIRGYNRRMASLYENVRDFIIMHYILSQRDDTAFWRDCRHVEVPDSLRAILDLHDEIGLVEAAVTEVFHEVSYHSILAGGGRLPRRPLSWSELADFSKVCAILPQIKAQNQEWLEVLPPHRELVQWLHRQVL